MITVSESSVAISSLSPTLVTRQIPQPTEVPDLELRPGVDGTIVAYGSRVDRSGANRVRVRFTVAFYHTSRELVTEGGPGSGSASIRPRALAAETVRHESLC